MIEESCGAIIWKKKNNQIKFLILKKNDEKNVWEPPKGHINNNETEKTTAKRELLEELWLSKIKFYPRFKEVLEYKNKKGNTIRIVLFLVEAQDITLSLEHSTHKWVSYNQLKTFFKYKDILEIYKKAKDILYFFTI